MGTFVLKRKLYAEDPNQPKKSGMGLGTKLALGAAAVGGSLYGAKKGMFGARAMKSVNTGLMKAGQKVGGNVGDKMILSGAGDYGKAKVRLANSAMAKKTGAMMTKKTQQQVADNIAMNQIDKYTGGGAWGKAAGTKK